MDKDFKYHRAITQMWADMTLTLADSVILPMDITGYATYLKEAFTDIKTRYGKKLSDNSANLGAKIYYNFFFFTNLNQLLF